MNISSIPTEILTTSKLSTNKISCLVGSVTFFAYLPQNLTTTSIPGFLVCDGSYVSKQTYSDLYNFLKNNNTNYPENSTQFQLPDLRGKFVRNTPFGSNNDPDGTSNRAANTYQDYAIKRLTGRMGVYQNDYDRLDYSGGIFYRDRSWGGTDDDYGGDWCGYFSFNMNNYPTNAFEARPNNIGFLACIKY